ncbi:unnamed protein product [Orchesella dallaii]|uniref:F-box domain-containing protein n=1 Tax=Orchesella dallaii TaxID=48710 RepID=A0ABP1RSD3_9HEXA
MTDNDNLDGDGGALKTEGQETHSHDQYSSEINNLEKVFQKTIKLGNDLINGSDYDSDDDENETGSLLNFEVATDSQSSGLHVGSEEEVVMKLEPVQESNSKPSVDIESRGVCTGVGLLAIRASLGVAPVISVPQQLHAQLWVSSAETMDEVHPLLLPPVYEKIFDYLDVPDLLACMSTCPEWESFLRPRRPLFLFRKAIYEVAKVTNMSKHDFLNCRLVCRTWNKVVVALYTNPIRVFLDLEKRDQAFPMFATGLESVATSMKSGKMFYVDEGVQFKKGLEHIRQFLKHMGNHSSNPILGRRVTVRLRSSEEYWNGFREVLLKFGKQIWYMDLKIDDTNNPQKATDFIMTRLGDLLSLIPNLKWFQLKVKGEPSYEVISKKIFQLVAKSGNIYWQPFPMLAHLETFICYNGVSNANEYQFTGADSIVSSFISCCCSANKLKALVTPDLMYTYFQPFPRLENMICVMPSTSVDAVKRSSPRLNWKKSCFHVVDVPPGFIPPFRF